MDHLAGSHKRKNVMPKLCALEYIIKCNELLNTTRKAALEALPDKMVGVETHRGIFEAVKAGNEEEAGRLMKSHLEIAYRNLLHQKETAGQQIGEVS